jgi:hypothetical protein
MIGQPAQPQVLFRRRALAAMIAVGLAAFIGSTYLMMFGEFDRTVGASTLSSSAIGHKAFLETLQRVGIPASASRFNSLEKVGDGGLLILAEPDTDEAALEIVSAAKRGKRLLLVLPKRTGLPDRRQEGWLSLVLPLDDEPEEVLERLLPDADLVTTTGNRISVNNLGPKPALEEKQLIRSDKLSPVIAYDEGILLGVTGSRSNPIWVLSDPDLIANAGIGQGENAAAAVAMVEALLPAGGAVVFDEVIHGLEQAPNMLRVAFEPPFLTVTIAFALAALTAILAGLTRLGAPKPTPPPLAAGRETLLHNTAALLEHGNGAGAVMARYPHLVAADVAQRLHVPKTLDEAGQIAWLDRRAQKRGLIHSASDLLAMAGNWSRQSDHRGRARQLGEMTHHWKQEMLHGTGRRAVD